MREELASSFEENTGFYRENHTSNFSDKQKRYS